MEPSASVSSGQEEPSNLPAEEATESIAARASSEALAAIGSPERIKKGPERFDFRQPAFLPPTEMRNLRKHHADFIEGLTASLANYLRTDVLLEVTKLQTLTYRDFVASLRTPAHVTLLKIEPLRGVCLVDIHPKLALAMVDRLLGGAGTTLEEGRELSEIETALLDQVIQLILTEWCRIWDQGKEIRPSVLAHETTSQYLRTSQPETTMLVLAMEARVGECIEQIQAVFPWPTVEPLFGQLAPKSMADNPAQFRETNQAKWRSQFGEIPLRFNAQGPGLEIAARDLAALQPGDILGLDAQFANHIKLSVGETAKFTGRLGTSGGKWAVEITAIQNV